MSAALLVMLLVSSALVNGQSSMMSAVQKTGQTADLLQWRADRAKSLSAPDGWLTLVGLEWLKPGKNAVGLATDNQVHLHGHAPNHLGVIEVSGSQLRLTAPAGGFPPGLMVDGKPAVEGPIQPDDNKASVISDDNLKLVVLHRGDRYALRIKDALSPTRTQFKGLHWYAPDASYRLTAKWIPFNPPHTEKNPKPSWAQPSTCLLPDLQSSP